VRPGAIRLPTPRPAARRGSAALLLAVVPFLPLVAACGNEAPPAQAVSTPQATPEATPDARTRLAALAAAAKDRHMIATYTYASAGRPDRTVTVTRAPDRTWRVDIPGGALGGRADVSVVRTADGRYQCPLPSSAGTGPAGCVRVADPDHQLPADVDPHVQRVFTDWPDVLTDRRAPLSVSVARQLTPSAGECFAVESTSVSLTPPLDIGIYCFAADGTLTGARLDHGDLVLAGTPVAAPPTVTLPAPIVAGEPLKVAAAPEASA
jgi:hypothetical protein